MTITKIQTHHDKVQDFISSLISIFLLGLKNCSEAEKLKILWERLKCVLTTTFKSKLHLFWRLLRYFGFLLLSFIWKIFICFWKYYLMFTIKVNTFPHTTFQKFFVCEKFQWWRLFCKKLFEKNPFFTYTFELSTTACSET